MEHPESCLHCEARVEAWADLRERLQRAATVLLAGSPGLRPRDGGAKAQGIVLALDYMRAYDDLFAPTPEPYVPQPGEWFLVGDSDVRWFAYKGPRGTMAYCEGDLSFNYDLDDLIERVGQPIPLPGLGPEGK